LLQIGISLLFQLVNFATNTIGFILKKSAFPQSELIARLFAAISQPFQGTFLFAVGLFGLAIPL
jgi:hypothetical protein